MNTFVLGGNEIADVHFGCVRLLAERGSLLDEDEARALAAWITEQVGPVAPGPRGAAE